MSLDGSSASYLPYTINGLQEISVDASTVNTLQVNSLTPNRVVVADSSNFLISAAASTTEVDFLVGTTSNVQSQLNSKASLTYVDTNFLNKTTSTPQTVQSVTTYLNGLTVSDNRPTNLSSKVEVDANYETLTTSGDVTVSQYFGTISNVGVVYQATTQTGGDAVLSLFSITAGQRASFTISFRIYDPVEPWFVEIYQSADNITPYLGVVSIVENFPIGDNTFHILGQAFTASTTGFICARISSGTPSATVVVEWKDMATFEMGVSLTDVSMPAQIADRVLVLNDKNQLVSSGINTTKLGYLDNVSSDIQTQLNARVLKAGDTMTGNLLMGANKVQSTTTPTVDDDLTRKGYVDTQDGLRVLKTGDTMTGTLDMGSNKITTTYVPVNGPDLINKTYGDATYATTSALSGYLPLTGGTLTGNFTVQRPNAVSLVGGLDVAQEFLESSFTLSGSVIGGSAPASIISNPSPPAVYEISYSSNLSGAFSFVSGYTPVQNQVLYYEFTKIYRTGLPGDFLSITFYQGDLSTPISTTEFVSPTSYATAITISGTFTLLNSNPIYMGFQSSTFASTVFYWDSFTLMRPDVKISGYVGIGTDLPATSLQVAKRNAYASRASNPLESNIIANSGSQRLYLGSYYTGGVGAASTIQSSDYFLDGGDFLDHGAQLLLNPLGGNVGIGTDDTSTSLLRLFSTTAARETCIYVRAFQASLTLDTITGRRWNIWSTEATNAVGSGCLAMYDNTAAAYRLVINPSGNVGLNTTSTNAPLQFSNSVQNRKIVLYETVNNDHQYYGFGINGGILRYQVDSTGANHVFYAGTSASTSTELMRIRGTGPVSIANYPASGAIIFNNPGTPLLLRNLFNGNISAGALSTYTYNNNSVTWGGGLTVSNAFFLPNSTCTILFVASASLYTSVISPATVTYTFTLGGINTSRTSFKFFNTPGNHEQVFYTTALSASVIGGAGSYNITASTTGITDVNDTIHWSVLVIG